VKRVLAVSSLLLLMLGVLIPTAKAAPLPCADPNQTSCGDAHLTADGRSGDFHGLIMVPGQESVLEHAAHAGTKPGCGDCTWELIVACLRNGPGPDQDPASCAMAAGSTHCRAGQLLYRLFLSTDAVRNQIVDLICLGGIDDVIPVGDLAATDVQRYLRDVHPPLLELHLSPPNGVPAGMAAYFWVRPPADLRPAPFGSGLVTETITITPQRYRWDWGDGDATGWTTDAGAPYPDGTLTHTYRLPDRYSGDVTTEWGGTYTITVQGETFGPYDAIGTVTRTQPFTATELSARSELVSHG
jgi:hypothetical protein